MKNPDDLFKYKPLFDQYCRLQEHQLSAFHFSSIFLWQDFFDFEFELINESLCIFANQNNASFLYLLPLCTRQEEVVIEQCFAKMDKINPRTARIENVSQKDLPLFKDYFKAYPKASEYVYEKQDLIDLQGHAYKSQRHDIHHFQAHYQGLFRPYEDADLRGCMDLYERWAQDRSKKHTDEIYLCMLEENRRVHELACMYHKALGLTGYVVEIDQVITAYSFGYSLNCRIFCVLLEITDLEITGLSAFIFNRFCATEGLREISLINTMDDFGMPYVASSKQAYHPKAKPISYTISRIK